MTIGVCMLSQLLRPLQVAHSEPVSSLPPRVSIPLPSGPGQLTGLHGGASRQHGSSGLPRQQVGGAACTAATCWGRAQKQPARLNPCSLSWHVMHMQEQC